jgi:hypothetical protein
MVPPLSDNHYPIFEAKRNNSIDWTQETSRKFVMSWDDSLMSLVISLSLQALPHFQMRHKKLARMPT